MPEHVLAVIDGNSLLHRAFHALPVTMTAPDGRPTNAVFGFMSMLLKLADAHSPDTLIVAFDKGRPAFRTEVLERYKVHRPPTPEDLRPQFGMVKGLLEAMRVPIVEAEGWEGDDILGALAVRGTEAGMRVLLFTGDKDAMQLVTDNVSVVTTRQGITDIKVYDPAAVEERLGVTPAQVPDYLGLKGDASDNIPGVPGIGEKTAAKLLRQYGSLDAVLEHADEVPGRIGENLRANFDAARASRTVATIRCDAPVDVDVTAHTWGDIDADAVARAFRELRIMALVEKVLALGRRTAARAEAGARDAGPPDATAPDASVGSSATAPPTASAPPAGMEDWTVVEKAARGRAVSEASASAANPVHPTTDTPEVAIPGGTLTGAEALAALRMALAGAATVAAVAGEAGDSLFPCLEVAFALPSGDVALVDEASVPAAILESLERGTLVAPDLKALVERAAPPGDPGSDIAPYLAAWDPARTFDVALAAYVLESGRSTYDVPTLATELTGHALEVPSDPHARAAALARASLALAPALRERLERDAALDCYARCDLPLVPVLARMEAAGVRVDTAVLAGLAGELFEGIERLRAEIFELAGMQFTIDSPKQLGEVLFDKLGLPTGRRTKTGWSTDAQVLTPLASAFPIAAKVLEYREMTKLKSTYVDALPRLVAADGRLHTTFNQTVAATGRLSSSNPNLQNIPVRTPLGQRIRAAFMPAREGDLIVSADYSQIELRILAHLSEDEALIDAFTTGEDFHTETASRVFAVPHDELTPEHRRRAKAVNFGIVYGISSHGLSESLKVPRAEAQAMIDRYFAAYPKVRAYLDRTVTEAHANGYAVTMYGRRRWIPELRSPNHNLRSFGERTAMNHPMQGSAADIMKLAMIEVDRRLRAEGFEARMLLQVHDELVFESSPDEVERLAEMVHAAMECVVTLSVPVDAHVSWGNDWASAK
jgi:DNA polymerase-1